VAVSASEEEIRRRALSAEKVPAYLNGRQVVKVIVVPRKLVNIVVK
jgi:leucyl-tRNA synthetase